MAASSAGEKIERLWRISCVLPFPMHAVLDPDGRLPEKASFITRIPPWSLTTDELYLSVGPVARQELDAMSGPAMGVFEPAELVVETHGSDAGSALDGATDTIERVIGSLSFQLQSSLRIIELSVLDVTRPVAVGEDRDLLLFPAPGGYPLRMFAPAVTNFGVETALLPDIGFRLSDDDYVARATDWYLKAIAAPLEADRFMFLWIAAEILWAASGIRATEPYRPPCGHQLLACPECGEATEKLLMGAGIQAFLVERFGVAEADALKLWRTRQMFHGAIRLDSEFAAELPALTRQLGAGVVQQLKIVSGIDQAAPPNLPAEGLSVSPIFGLGGSRQVEASDLRYPDS